MAVGFAPRPLSKGERAALPSFHQEGRQALCRMQAPHRHVALAVRGRTAQNNNCSFQSMFVFRRVNYIPRDLVACTTAASVAGRSGCDAAPRDGRRPSPRGGPPMGGAAPPRRGLGAVPPLHPHSLRRCSAGSRTARPPPVCCWPPRGGRTAFPSRQPALAAAPSALVPALPLSHHPLLSTPPSRPPLLPCGLS